VGRKAKKENAVAHMTAFKKPNYAQLGRYDGMIDELALQRPTPPSYEDLILHTFLVIIGRI